MRMFERWREWREKRQRERCAAGRHHWRVFNNERVYCYDPGCGKKWAGE